MLEFRGGRCRIMILFNSVCVCVCHQKMTHTHTCVLCIKMIITFCFLFIIISMRLSRIWEESDIALTSGLQKISPGSVASPQNVQKRRPRSLAKTFRAFIRAAAGSSERFAVVAAPGWPSLPVTVNLSVVMRSWSSSAVNSTRSPSLLRICSLRH